jgi:hypothetical protein
MTDGGSEGVIWGAYNLVFFQAQLAQFGDGVSGNGIAGRAI